MPAAPSVRCRRGHRGRPGRPGALAALAARRARGFSLIVILVMVLVMSLLVLGGLNSSVIQERMAGNTRDRHVALQAAEAALRDAERDIDDNITAASAFSTACTDGLCIPASETASGAQSAPVWQGLNWASVGRLYGSRTGAAALPGPGNTALAGQPRYLIERLPALPPRAGDDSCTFGGCSNNARERPRAYRITARATGVRESTVVVLQSVYVKP